MTSLIVKEEKPKQFYSDAKAEQDRLLNRLKEIRETLVEAAYAHDTSSRTTFDLKGD